LHEKPITVTYKPAPGLASQQEYQFQQKGHNSDAGPIIEVEVLTPAFYSRMVHYTSNRILLLEEALPVESRNRTLFVSDLDSLTALLDSAIEITEAPRVFCHMPLIDRLRWKGLRLLRCKSPSQSFPNHTSDGAEHNEKQQSADFTLLDQHAAQDCFNGEPYRRNVTQLFLAQRYAGGFPGLISLFDLSARAMLTMFGLSMALSLVDPPKTTDISDLESTMKFMLFNAVHGWAFLKGVSAPTGTGGRYP